MKKVFNIFILWIITGLKKKKRKNRGFLHYQKNRITWNGRALLIGEKHKHMHGNNLSHSFGQPFLQDSLSSYQFQNSRERLGLLSLNLTVSANLSFPIFLFFINVKINENGDAWSIIMWPRAQYRTQKCALWWCERGSPRVHTGLSEYQSITSSCTLGTILTAALTSRTKRTHSFSQKWYNAIKILPVLKADCSF